MAAALLSLDNEMSSLKRKSPSPSDDEEHATSSSDIDSDQDHLNSKRLRMTTSSGIASRVQKSKPTNTSTPPSDLASTPTAPQTKTSFTSLSLAPWITNTLRSLSITSPTPIQSSCIPAIINGKDCIGISRTGSGKTIAFAAPILHQWSQDPCGIFAVILTPTRELALQIYEQFNALGSPHALKPVLVTGGSDMRRQAIELARRPHVVIATPGRLADHITTNGDELRASFRRVKFLVLDEADRLLNQSGPGSMVPDVETCVAALPSKDDRQTCLFTATLTPEVQDLTSRPRPAGHEVHMCQVDTHKVAVPDTLQQTYMTVPVTQREPFLHELLITPANEKASIIIFANQRTTATLLEHMLRSLGHRVTALHGGLTQAQRTSNLARFKARAARILIASDVASRGLDIPEVELVINYDVPRNPDDYIHRVGRTARAGKTGQSVTFIGQRDVDLVHAIEDRVGTQMIEYEEENVNIQTRVMRDSLRIVGEKKREAMMAIEEGREVTGRKKAGPKSLLKDSRGKYRITKSS